MLLYAFGLSPMIQCMVPFYLMYETGVLFSIFFITKTIPSPNVKVKCKTADEQMPWSAMPRTWNAPLQFLQHPIKTSNIDHIKFVSMIAVAPVSPLNLSQHDLLLNVFMRHMCFYRFDATSKDVSWISESYSSYSTNYEWKAYTHRLLQCPIITLRVGPEWFSWPRGICCLWSHAKSQ